MLMKIERAREVLGIGANEEPTKAWLLGYDAALWHRRNKKSFDDKCRESHAIHAFLMTHEDYRLEMEAEEKAYREECERLSDMERDREIGWVIW